MFACRWPSDPTGARFSGYFAAMHATIAGPLFDAHDPPGGVGPGDGGAGAGVAAGVVNDSVTDHALVVSPSPARRVSSRRPRTCGSRPCSRPC